jgi:hypothetical protein
MKDKVRHTNPIKADGIYATDIHAECNLSPMAMTFFSPFISVSQPYLKAWLTSGPW